MKIYIGYDSENWKQWIVCKKSLLKFNKDLEIIKLEKNELIDKGIYLDSKEDGSTEFTYTRFLVPYLSNYEGLALFCDSDFLWNCDVKEIFESFNKKENFSVACVKHDYKNCLSKVKMNNKKQEWYPKKNWSSLMLFNCKNCKNLTPELVNKKNGRLLHRLEWCQYDILSLDKKYNYLVGYYKDLNFSEIKALHYTDGTPDFENYKFCDFYQYWLKYL